MRKASNPPELPEASAPEDNTPRILDQLDRKDIELFRELATTHETPTKARRLLRVAGIDTSSLPPMDTIAPDIWWEDTRDEIKNGRFGPVDTTVARLIATAYAGHPGNRTYQQAREVLVELKKVPVPPTVERANEWTPDSDARVPRGLKIGLSVAAVSLVVCVVVAGAWLIATAGERRVDDEHGDSSADVDGYEPLDLPEPGESSTDTGTSTTKADVHSSTETDVPSHEEEEEADDDGSFEPKLDLEPVPMSIECKIFPTTQPGHSWKTVGKLCESVETHVDGLQLEEGAGANCIIRTQRGPQLVHNLAFVESDIIVTKLSCTEIVLERKP